MTPAKRRTVGLRIRVAALFAAGALVLSVVLSVVTFQVSRSYLLRNRDALAVREAVVHAQVVANVLTAPTAEPRTIVDGLAGSNSSRPLLRVADDWYAAAVELGEGQVPTDLAAEVQTGLAARQRAVVNGVPYIVTGVPLAGLDAQYFEFAPLVELPRTLRIFGRTLIATSATVTLLGAALGWWASRRILHPLREVSVAARAISGGDLTTRLDVGDDPDLAPLANAFNEMAQAVEDRMDREMRFTADVSHELRTPLTAILSAVELARRSDLSPRAELAIDLLAEQASYFRDLVMDLLAISRFDGGAVTVEIEPVDVGSMVRRIVTQFGLEDSVLCLDFDPHALYAFDRRRLELMLVNLIDNAGKYGGGVTRLEVTAAPGWLIFAVEDGGPGVSPEERKAIFGRFTRGSAAGQAGAPKGTGLGLALVDEHARAHGGSVEVLDAAGGGARFVITIPAGMEAREAAGASGP
jgi:signal transduction histidine kinase